MYRLYNKLDLYTAEDLLFYYPRTYMEYPEELEDLKDKSKLSEGEAVALLIRVDEACRNRKTSRMDITTLSAFCGDVPVDMVWFRSPYIKSQIRLHESYVFYGRVSFEGTKGIKLEQPVVYTREKYALQKKSLQPVYTLTKGLTNNQIKKNIRQILEEVTLSDFMPKAQVKKRELETLPFALRMIHFPDDFDSLSRARNRLVYDEFFLFLAQMELSKQDAVSVPNSFSVVKEELYKKVLSSLPFPLTKGQESALQDVRSDVAGSFVTQRLIQGDVGSGKTVIAFLLMTLFCENGYATAIMAPTEILATQHYNTFSEYVKTYDLPFETVLLTGSLSAKQKREVYDKLKEKRPMYIIGTHALIQEKADYENLALVITDEQHRFGVKQRDTLAKKGIHPFSIVMSATPIPRTLSMILYGDMNISVISDVPARRLPIKNAVIKEQDRNKAYRFIAKEVEKGHQAYVICPLVSAGETTEEKNVTDYTGELKKVFPKTYGIGMLHGRMKPAEKNAVMDAFLKNEIQILVSTTVVEVGVNVPNATVMMIENANRFGLAQLHQLRGRVGRGDAQSYCIFIDGTKDEEYSKRLEIISKSNDGFYIAGEDLKLRGPGDFYGIRQSGDLDFHLADIYQDAQLLQKASEDVKEFVSGEKEGEEEKKLLHHILHQSQRQYTNL